VVRVKEEEGGGRRPDNSTAICRYGGRNDVIMPGVAQLCYFVAIGVVLVWL